MGEGGVDRHGGGSGRRDGGPRTEPQSDGTVGSSPTVDTRVECVREPDILFGETDLASTFVAQLPFGLVVRRVGGYRVGAHCSNHHGSGHMSKTTHANAGGGLGVVRDAGTSHVRADSDRQASGGATVRICDDAPTTAGGRCGGSVGMATFDDHCAGRAGRITGV